MSAGADMPVPTEASGRTYRQAGSSAGIAEILLAVCALRCHFVSLMILPSTYADTHFAFDYKGKSAKHFLFFYFKFLKLHQILSYSVGKVCVVSHFYLFVLFAKVNVSK